MSETSGKFQSLGFAACSSSNITDASQKSSEPSQVQRVYRIDRIAPDPFLDTWKSVPLIPKKSNLMKRIATEFAKPESFDVSVLIGNDVFNCLMLTLQSYSKFFKARSRHEKSITLESTKISSTIFQNIYEWILTKSKSVSRSGLIPLLMGAQYLQVELLEQQIWNLIQDGSRFQENEAFFLYLEAKQWKFWKIQCMMMHRVQRFFMSIVCSEEFLSMEPEEIKLWLQLDSIGVNSEVDVFYSACRWLLHHWDDRKVFLMDVMKHVRFGLIEPWRIVEFRQNKNTGRIQEILDNCELQAVLEPSLSYSVYRMSKDELTEEFGDFLTRFGLKRLFSRESSDAYWQMFHTDSTFTYEDFEVNLPNKLRPNVLANWRNSFVKHK